MHKHLSLAAEATLFAAPTIGIAVLLFFLLRPFRLFVLAVSSVLRDMCCPCLRGRKLLPTRPVTPVTIQASTSKAQRIEQTAQALSMSGMQLPEVPQLTELPETSEETIPVIVEAVDRAKSGVAEHTALTEAKQTELETAAADWQKSMLELVGMNEAMMAPPSPPPAVAPPSAARSSPSASRGPVSRLAGAVVEGAAKAISSFRSMTPKLTSTPKSAMV